MCSVRARRVASSRVAWLVLFLDLPQAAQVWNLKYLCTFWYTHAQANTHACTSTSLAHCALRTPFAGMPVCCLPLWQLWVAIGANWSKQMQLVYFGRQCTVGRTVRNGA